jgi:hypothetical protein
MAKIRIECAVPDFILGSEWGAYVPGVAHLPGGGDAETLCGFFASGTIYEDSDGVPTCWACIDQARVVFRSITKKELMGIK